MAGKGGKGLIAAKIAAGMDKEKKAPITRSARSGLQAWSNKEVKHLQGVNESLLKRIVELKGTVKTLNSKIDPLTLDDSLNQFVEQCLGSEDVIYLVGGFDGSSFVPSLDSFSPSLDVLTSLRPMAVGKSYTSTVALEGKIFVLGGGDCTCWFDTVDYYDRSRDDWFTCASLTREKGRLAGVSVNGRIYAFGGGDGTEFFSDVEMFDLAHGKWIKNQPMLEKRFAIADVALNGVIYAVGGFNGVQYLRCCTFPLEGKIFVLGGGDGTCWFDTVDCYDRSRDDWFTCPSLTREKGSLAGVSVNGRIYAFGGGDGTECFSYVEMFDLTHGKWIKNQLMLEKRFALAGVALNGVIYAVGGFNGVQYLSSTERLDPLEPNWKMLPKMSAGRACHPLTVLDEKIFSIGGYNTGAKAMVSTVEVYEPRMLSWMMVEPMSYTRGYHSSAVLGGSIFTFGGVKGEVDTVLDAVLSIWKMTDEEEAPRRKRVAGTQINKDNPEPDDEGPEQEMGAFKKATEQVMATQRIVKLIDCGGRFEGSKKRYYVAGGLHGFGLLAMKIAVIMAVVFILAQPASADRFDFFGGVSYTLHEWDVTKSYEEFHSGTFRSAILEHGYKWQDLDVMRYPQSITKPPRAWIAVEVKATGRDGDRVTLAIRDDNLYLIAFANKRDEWFCFKTQRSGLPCDENNALPFTNTYG